MNTTPWLEVFVLCHNRPELAKIAIQSILDQRASDYQLTVSDNSSDQRVARMVLADFPGVRLIRRGGVPALMHFNACIAEARTDYFCLFHDDDMMGTDFVAEMHLASERFPEAVAIGTNSWEVNLARGTRVASFRGYGPYQSLATARELFRRYFGRYQGGNAPFPSYVYRTAVTGQQRIPEGGGKYADVSWLLHLATLGRIVWVNKLLMDYNQHSGNDSLQESRRDRLRFLGFIKCNPVCADSSELGDCNR